MHVARLEWYQGNAERVDALEAEIERTQAAALAASAEQAFRTQMEEIRALLDDGSLLRASSEGRTTGEAILDDYAFLADAVLARELDCLPKRGAEFVETPEDRQGPVAEHHGGDPWAQAQGISSGDRVFGPASGRGSFVVSGANGIVGAGKLMQLGSRLEPFGVPIVALDFPGVPDGIGGKYAGLVSAFGSERAAAIMGNVIRLSYDGQNLPSQLAALDRGYRMDAGLVRFDRANRPNSRC